MLTWMKSKALLLLDNVFILALGVLFLGLAFKYVIAILLFVAYFIYFFLYKHLDKIYFFVMLVFGMVFFLCYNQKSNLSSDIDTINIQVTEISKGESSIRVTGKYKHEYVMIYVKAFNYEVGDHISVKGVFEKASEASYKGDFDYKEYLEYQRVFYVAYSPSVSYLKNGFTIEEIEYRVLTFYEENLSLEAFDYVNALVFGNNEFDDEFKSDLSNLGITHLFAISGLHILLLFSIIKRLLFFISKNVKKNESTALVFLIVYVVLFCYEPSAIRAVLFLTLTMLGLRNIEVLSVAFLGMVLFNPNYLFQQSFCLSFLVSFAFVTIPLRGKGKIIKSIEMTFLAILITFPILINMNFKLNILTLILSPIFVFLFTICIIPISFILVISPLGNGLFTPVYQTINKLISNLSLLDNLTVYFPYFNSILLVTYYILFVLLVIGYIKRKKLFMDSSILVSFLVIVCNLELVNPYLEIHFIDVGQGDSTLIKLPNNKGNILIDSFGDNIDFLHSLGVYEIDYLIITHGDTDHMGTALDVMDEFRVKNLVVSYYDYSDNILTLLNNVNTIRVRAGNQLKIGEYVFKIVGPVNDYEEINDISIVIWFECVNRFLFTGDMGEAEEYDLIDLYGSEIKADILKVGHHGSDTSSSQKFLDIVNPSICMISVGKNNYYGHPSEVVLKRLEGKRVYQTKDNGNIKVSILNNNVTIKAYR